MNAKDNDLEAALQALCNEPGRALPAACYLNPEFFELESNRVLRPGWHAVARSAELAEVGAYRSVDLMGEPILLVRDEGGELRAMSRVCLHRAHPIVEGKGTAKGFVCPYHRWSYGLDGKLRGAPMMDEVPGFDRKGCELPKIAIFEWQGFVLVNVGAEADASLPQLSALTELLAPWRLDSYRRVATLDYESPWNWKVMVENFMESYHHIGPHVNTLQPINPAKGTHWVPLEGDFSVLENPATDDAQPFWVVQVFPTLLLSLSRGSDPFATWYEMQFDNPFHFRLRIHILLPEEAAQNKVTVETYRKIVDLIHQEDIPVCEGVQRGFASSTWTPGLLSVHETPLVKFHEYLSERLT